LITQQLDTSIFDVSMDDSVIEIQDDSSILEVMEDKENLNNRQTVAAAGRPSKVVAQEPPQQPLKRKETRGGVKLDDTIDLDDSDDDANSGKREQDSSSFMREIGDGASDVEETVDKADHFTTATEHQQPSLPQTPPLSNDVTNNDVTGVNCHSFVTSTPAVNGANSATLTDDTVANYTYEHNQTAKINDVTGETNDVTREDAGDSTFGGQDPVAEGEIQDEMCDSYDEKVSLMTSLNPVTSSSHLPAHPACSLRNGVSKSGDEDSSDDVTAGNDDDEEEEPADDEISSDDDEEDMSMPSKQTRQLDPAHLPETCTVLTTNHGGRVYLVGTAHFSQESNEDVAKVIRAVQPDVVVLELCKARTTVLHLDEERSLELAQNLTLERMVEMVKEQGAVQGLMTATMLSMSAHLTKELGMAPGGEFRRAYREAKEIPGCLVHLGDRPIQVTLRRAVGSLSVWQMIKLGLTMLTSKASITKEEVEKYKQKDVLEAMLEEMAGEYPSFSKVLVEERDLFLAHSMWLAANAPWRVSPQKETPRGKGAQAPVVVGVVGIGHKKGIIKNWGQVTTQDVAKVVQIPEPTASQKYTKLAIKTSFVILSLYGSYRILRNPISRLTKILTK